MWTITDGDYYVHSQIGDDLNAGTMALPFKTLQKSRDSAGAGEKIVARGYFKEFATGVDEILVADGYCELDGAGVVGGVYAVYNLAIIQGFRIRNFSNPFFSTIDIIDCTIEDCANQGHVIGVNFINTVFRNTRLGFDSGGSSVNAATYLNCTFINVIDSKFSPGCVIRNCLFDINCRMTSVIGVVSSNFNVWEDGCEFNGGDLAAWKLANPVLDLDSIEVADAKINDSQDYDFTIATDSPCVGAGQAGIDVGATLKSFSMDGLNVLFDGVTGNGSKSVNVVIDGSGHVTLNTGDGTFGTIESDVIDLIASGLTNPVGRVLLFGDEDMVNGDIFDESVVGAENYTYEMRWGTDIPTTIALEYQPFLRRKEASIDSLGRGNGNSSFDESTEVKLAATHIQLRITIKNTL